jgi:AraC-like DNA-binding protein
LKEAISINFMPDSQADIEITKLQANEIKDSVNYAKSVLTRTSQAEMLRQIYSGRLIYLEFISFKTQQALTLNIKAKQSYIAFIYVIEGVLRFSLPGSSSTITVAEGHHFVMSCLGKEQNWQMEKGEVFIYLFILQPQFILDIQEDYQEIAVMTESLMNQNVTFSISQVIRTSSETKRVIKKIRSFKANTRLIQELGILQATSKLITQYAFELRNPVKIPYRSNKEMAYVIQDYIISDIKKGILPQVSRISEYFKIESKTIRRICLKAFNMNTQAVIINARMKVAYSLMKNGVTVREAAYRLGYTEPAAFSRAFKKYFGHSPNNEKKSAN